MPYSILYVEDESAIIELVDIVLSHPNIRLLKAVSGEKGLELARIHKPDLIVLDVMIPDRNGWSIYREIRADAELGGRPIIMLTGQIHKYRIMKEFSTSQIDAYITKPFEVGSIRAEVEKMLGVAFWSAHPVTPG